MAVGKVKWFNDEKGWGFIKQDVGPDVFVHYSQIHGDGRKRLFEDEMVEFEIGSDRPPRLLPCPSVSTDIRAVTPAKDAIPVRSHCRRPHPAAAVPLVHLRPEPPRFSPSHIG